MRRYFQGYIGFWKHVEKHSNCQVWYWFTVEGYGCELGLGVDAPSPSLTVPAVEYVIVALIFANWLSAMNSGRRLRSFGILLQHSL